MSRHAATMSPLNAASFTGQYLHAVLADARANGRMSADRKHMAELERENLAALHDLAQGERVPVEA